MQKQDIVINHLQECNIKFLLNQPLKNYTTFKIGGIAALVCCPKTEIEITNIITFLNKENVKYYIIGKGSNILFCDEGFDGVIVQIANGKITVDKNIVTADAGTSLAQLCKTCAENGLAGLEFAFGIPGAVGGAIYMNAGAYGGEIKDVVLNVKYLSKAGKVCSLTGNQLDFSYRHSIFETTGDCVLQVSFQMQYADKQQILSEMQKYAQQRADKQPLDMPSAGSTFKRPEGAFAGALIDSCGLRGYQVGGAAISQKHCGFVVNVDKATCADVIKLTDDVKEIVKQKTGFILEREIRIVK